MMVNAFNIPWAKFWEFFIEEREVYLFSPNINEEDKNHNFPKYVKFYKNWDALIQELNDKFG